jgi:60 kDa SS-A/Ro ribonucleoprotein
MAKINIPKESLYTHEGAKAKHINSAMQLKRSVMACMLWENEFYEDGKSIASRIQSIIPKVDPAVVASIAESARTDMKLRHVPLLVVREMARLPKHKHYVAKLLPKIIQRADELSEFLAIYWKNGKQPLSAQVKKGLASAFPKFNAYQLAKYNRDGAVKLRDVLFLCHAKPKDEEQKEVWKKLVDGTLESPDTWEVNLSSGADKKETWERLLKENKLGALALLRNLRNFQKDDVDEALIIDSIENMKVEKVLPFRFIAAARYAPQWKPILEKAMFKCLNEHEKLSGHTVLLLDVSGSMEENLSKKSDMTRLDAACGVAMLAREICDKVDIFTFSEKLVRVPPRQGFSLRDAIVGSQNHGGTLLGLSVKAIYSEKPVQINLSSSRQFLFEGQNINPDRLIVITDEQSHDPVSDPKSKGYMINVASNKNGVGYGPWVHIDGWSEAVIKYIIEMENYEN